ncbi:MAG: preprotein translocase subunit SecG [Candidatus Woykebacteria bacterium]
MRLAMLVLLIVISVSIIVLVLAQQRGGGAGAVFGGGGEVYRSRRGVEKIFHRLTIFLAALFSLVSFSLIFIK